MCVFVRVCVHACARHARAHACVCVCVFVFVFACVNVSESLCV